MKIKDTCFYEVKWTEEQTRMEEDTQSSVSSAGGEKTWDSPRNWQYQVPGGRNITVVWELVMKTCCWAADCWRKICTPFPLPNFSKWGITFLRNWTSTPQPGSCQGRSAEDNRKDRASYPTPTSDSKTPAATELYLLPDRNWLQDFLWRNQTTPGRVSTKKLSTSALQWSPKGTQPAF